MWKHTLGRINISRTEITELLYYCYVTLSLYTDSEVTRHTYVEYSTFAYGVATFFVPIRRGEEARVTYSYEYFTYFTQRNIRLPIDFAGPCDK